MHKKSPAFRFPYGSGRGFIISGAVMLLGRHNAALVLVLHKLLDLIALQVVLDFSTQSGCLAFVVEICARLSFMS